MLSHNISPIIFKIGNFPITYYWLIYFLGFLSALLLLLSASRKNEIKITKKQVYVLTFWGILSLMLGARLFHVLFWGLDYYLKYPDRIFYFWQGGMSFHGGLIGALLSVGIYCRIKKINFWQIADLFALLGIILPAFTRIANFINQEVVGTITNVPWCFKFKHDVGCRHPVQLYASAGRFAFFFLVLGIKKKLKDFKEGFIFWLFIVGIGFGRFALDFLRRDTKYFDLTAGQWLSLPMIFIGIFVLINYYKKEIKRII